MDVFYYWKDYKKDIENDMIGRFVSSKEKIGEMRLRYPDNIWAFKTPKGHLGRLQLIARMRWSDNAPPKLKESEKTNIQSMMYYDPEDSESIFYDNTDTEEAINHVTGLLKKQFLKAFDGNFQGDGGVRTMEKDFLYSFNKEIAKYSNIPFLKGIVKYKALDK